MKKKHKGKLIDYFLFYFAIIMSTLSALIKDYTTFSIGLFIILLASLTILIEKKYRENLDRLNRK